MYLSLLAQQIIDSADAVHAPVGELDHLFSSSAVLARRAATADGVLLHNRLLERVLDRAPGADAEALLARHHLDDAAVLGCRPALERRLPRAALQSVASSALRARAPALPATLPGGRPWPRISVVTPSFNQGRFIAETIESVLAQGYPAVEHIVIDGGSTDETAQVLERYRDRLACAVSELDRGQSDALNKGFARAGGDILCWLNSDDRLAPGALAAVAMAFHTSGADMVSGVIEVGDGQTVQHRHLSACADGPLPLADLLDLDTGWNAGQFFYQPEVFFTRELWRRAGAHVREDCHYSMDYELWCRFALAGARLHVVGATLARFRVHPAQKTADPALFKRELVGVRDRFAAAHGIVLPVPTRPPVRWDRVLRVAMVNDLGLRYGAGIAHGRVAAAIDATGHEVRLFALVDGEGQRADAVAVAAEVDAWAPDLVVFGNLHGAGAEAFALAEQLCARHAAFWVSHDFWILTGRCAYMQGCGRYLEGCDASCPTPDEYPALAPIRIAPAWAGKRALLTGPRAPTLLANSRWAASVVGRALAGADAADADTDAAPAAAVRRFSLGVPADVFQPLDRAAARASLGLAADTYVLVFSVSSLTDRRKGAHLLLEALALRPLPDTTVLLIGNADTGFAPPGVRVLALGYVEQPAALVAALSAADVYVGPSLEETFGQVFVEAAMCGAPSLAFAGSGTEDAVADGVGGWLLPPSAAALADALARLHADRALAAAMGAWARLHAVNAFSLEACYRSLFVQWRQAGRVDAWGLPHKIGFVRRSPLLPPPSATLPLWQAESGFSPREGPYPGLPFSFRWLHGRDASIVLRLPAPGPHVLRLHYLLRRFDVVRCAVRVDGVRLRDLVFVRCDGARSRCVDLLVDAAQPLLRLDLAPDRHEPPTVGEPRALVLMLREVEVLGVAAPA